MNFIDGFLDFYNWIGLSDINLYKVGEFFGYISFISLILLIVILIILFFIKLIKKL